MHLIWLSFMVDTWPCELLFGGRLEKPWAWQLLHPLWSRGAGIPLEVRVENTLSINNGTIVNSINKDKRKPNILELPRFYLSKNKIPSCLWMSHLFFVLYSHCSSRVTEGWLGWISSTPETVVTLCSLDCVTHCMSHLTWCTGVKPGVPTAVQIHLYPSRWSHPPQFINWGGTAETLAGYLT